MFLQDMRHTLIQQDQNTQEDKNILYLLLLVFQFQLSSMSLGSSQSMKPTRCRKDN
jgi:replication initiation and membrane attachment protein DnaB